MEYVLWYTIYITYLQCEFSIFCGYFSLEDGRIELDQSTPNKCSIKITNVTEDDNGAWRITSLLCSRGRGKRYENALLNVKGTYLRDILRTMK